MQARESRFDKVSLAGLRHSREGGNPNPGLPLQTTTCKDPPGYLAPPCADIPGAGVWIPAFAGMTGGYGKGQ